MSTFNQNLDAINAVSANIKKLIPTITTDVATEAAVVLVNAAENATIFEELEASTLLDIKGIGAKRAETIIANKLALIGKLVKLGEYSDSKKPSSPMIHRKKISFNQEFNPGKDAREKMFVVEDTLVVEGELARYFRSRGWDPEEDMFIFCGYISGSENSNIKDTRVLQQIAAWSHFCEDGVVRSGCKYKALFHGPNAGRKDEVLFCVAEYVDAARAFATLGTWGIGKNTEAKEASYAGLCIGGTTPLSKWIGGLEISPRNVVVVESFNKLFENIPVDYVDPTTGEVKLNIRETLKLVVSDGYGQMHISNELLTKLTKDKTPEQRLQIVEALKAMPCFTIRGGMKKGLIDTKVDFHAFFRAFGITTIKDKWGNVYNIDDVAMIIDESVLKVKIGEGGQFATYADYCDAFEKYGHTYQVMLVEHEDKPHNLPFQQLQSMVGAKIDTFRPAVENEIAKINAYQQTANAAKLLGGDMARIIMNVPEMHHLPFVATREAQAYDKIVRFAKAGVLHGITHNCFVAPDWLAFLQWVAYRDAEKVTGFIPANSVCCAVLDKEEACLSRNPSTDPQAQCVVKVVKPGELTKFVRYSTLCYTSIHSYEITRVRGDNDGDHLCITESEPIITMAKEANAMWGGRLIVWDDVTSGKHEITEDGMTAYFKSLTKVSQLGHFCDQMTSLVGFGHKGYDHKVACWLVMAINVFVDASKHGMGDVVIPDFVQEYLSLHDEAGNVLVDEYGLMIPRPMPIYAMQNKDNRNMKAKVKKVGGKRCAKNRGAGNGDILAKNIELNCKPMLQLDLTGIDKFNVNDLLMDYTGSRNGGNSFGLRGCEELFNNGVYNAETKKFDGEGLWKVMCFARGRYMKELIADMDDDDMYTKAAAQKAYKKQIRIMAIRELTCWAEENGKTIEDVYDAVTFFTWNMLRYPAQKNNESDEAFDKRVAKYGMQVEAWTDIFGGMALRAIYSRKNYLAAGGVISTFEDGLDELTDGLW